MSFSSRLMILYQMYDIIWLLTSEFEKMEPEYGIELSPVFQIQASLQPEGDRGYSSVVKGGNWIPLLAKGPPTAQISCPKE